MNRMLRSLRFVLAVGCLSTFVPMASAQARPAVDLFAEVEDYVPTRSRELASAGKRLDAAKREDIENEQKDLAAKYAMEVAARKDIAKTDFYYLGRLYAAAGNDVKSLDAMKRFLTQYPPETTGDINN